MTENKNRNDLVVQSNDLIEAYYDMDLTVNEHKIIRYVASKIKLHDNSFPDYSFEVKEFAKAVGVRGNNYHAHIEKIADELTKRRIKVKSKEKVGWFPWFSAIVYEKGIVHISFNPVIKDLILKLEERFTNYHFNAITPLRSGYSLRLFELLKQYEKIGHRTIELDELRMMLGISDKYQEYSSLKQRVVVRAQEELKEKTKLAFEFEEIKRGRKVVALKFLINSKYKSTQLSLFEEEEESLPVPEVEYSEFVKRTKRLFKGQGIYLNEEEIAKWETYGYDMMVEVADEIKGRNIKQHVRYIDKMLKAKEEERSKKDARATTKTKDPLADAIDAVILEYQNSSELLPDWMVGEGAINIFKQQMSVDNDTAQKLWKQHKDDIMKELTELIKTHRTLNNRKKKHA